MFARNRTNTFGAVALLGVLGGGSILPLPPILGGGDSGGTSGSSTSTAPTAAQFQAMGRTQEANGRLRRGCHYYAYTYRVTPPSNAEDWALETFLQGPHGKGLGADVIVSGSDPAVGTKRWRLCRNNTVAGVFTIKARITYDVYPDTYRGWVATSHFRLKPPRHRRHR